jgi:methylated-DNA-[protein]-cysteine S-methyltransferase
MDTKVYTTVDTPVGRLVLTGVLDNEGVLLDSISFGPGVPSGHLVYPGGFGAIERQLLDYFAGTSRSFDVPHTERGTPFQRSVWRAVDAIPYGRTVSYGALAESVGVARDRIRAVAAAVGANPLLVVRPCHRVIGADGALTGYAGGVPRKRALLVHEGALQPELV